MTARNLRRRLVSAASLTVLAMSYPAAALAAEAAAEQASGTRPDEEILVIGERYTSGIQPERELDQQGIESYGESTIDELVNDIQGELGDDEQPLILVNGERVSDVDEIGGLPVEALENVKVLPRGSAVRAGGTTGQRVVSLTLKKQTRSATALVAPKISTDGAWSAIRGEGVLTYIRDETRANVSLKARGESDLLESDRDIIQLETSPPNLGDFRTLRPKTRTYDLNGTVSTRLAPWLTGNAGVRLNHATRRSLRGLSTDGLEPLTTRGEHDGGDVNLTLNGHFGKWTSYLNARHSESTDVTRTDRQTALAITSNRAEARNRTDLARLAFTGPLFALPAGDAQATIEGQFVGNHLRSESDFLLVDPIRTFNRKETSLRGAIELPLTVHDGFGGAIGDLSTSGELSRVHYSDAGNVTNYQLGLAWEPRPVLRLSADLEKSSLPASVQLLGNPIIVTSGVRTFDPLTGESVDVTQITGGNPDLEPEKTTIHRFGAQVRLIERLNLQLNAEYTDTKERNFVSSLPDESAAVMQAFPSRFVRDLGGVLTTVDLRPVNFDSHREKRFRYGLSLSTRLGRGAQPVAHIAPPSDAESGDEGVNREEVPAPVASPPRARRGPATRVSLTASHSIVFKDEIIIRSGLPDVDLLEGGAIGIGGGRVRHQLDATASISSGGTGLRVSANWRGKSTLVALDETGTEILRFSPVFNLSLRAFADLHRFLPHQEWTRSTRISLNVLNATNDRQEVRDPAGNTPLRYQAGYRDPLGRTIELELRKVF